MLIKIGDFDCTECWDGVFYKKLSSYPDISKWEIQTILDFERYERDNGRDCQIEADIKIINAIDDYRKLYDFGQRVAVPDKITECVACPKYKGCMTDFVCHTAPIENAISIFECGALRAPTKWRGVPASVLKAESRNAANDPEDYFDYVMFAWGNCQAGDRLVMERKLKHFPTDEDLSENFTPGVRFFFKSDKIVKHPNATFEGVLPLKVKDEVVLSDWVHTIIIPLDKRNILESYIPANLKDRVFYIENDCADIWAWSEKVYEFAKNHK
ncbi:hypothetical protein [Butyrivibrio fibrisolvens]|uniref:hypothetical protein n=1 Tax=Butyrivibrio fibrisolvens TaxID=831 RepID=UPI0003B71640|nr:hypothetical protein [Butyrivibrio fibrisolvens]